MGRKFILVALLLLVSVVAFSQPLAAQSGAVWRAEFYNNGTLSGTPVLVRYDNAIGFNWSTGTPDPAVQADNFSVRWAADVNLPAGTYRFYAQADDNIRVIFNFGYQPVIDTFADSSKVGQLVTGDVNVPNAGTFHIQVDYRELTDQAYAYMTFANLASNPTFPGFPGQQQPPATGPGVPVTGGSWTAQYYANSNLSNDPSAIFTEGTPTHNWGSGSPLASIPADYFSARWTSIQNLTGGTYGITARADDGIRVYVNGVLQIDEWHSASGATYSRTLSLPAGSNTFVVEYFEATGNAFLEFNLTQGVYSYPTPVPTIVVNPPATSGVTATVTAYRLNVRNQPSATTGAVISRISRYEQYPVIGRTADSLWLEIQVGAALGWVSARFVNVSPYGAVIPVVGSGQSAPGTPQATGNAVTATPYSVVVRSGPSTSNTRIGLFPVGATAPVIGRNSTSTWWQINYNGLIGWVSSAYAIISTTANIGAIPVTG